MISDDEAQAMLADRFAFNYTAAQWAAISKQVSRIRTPMEPFSYRELLYAANVYLDESFKPPAEQSREWEAIADAARELDSKAFELRLQLAQMEGPCLGVAIEALERIEDLVPLEELERNARYHAAMARLSWSPKQRFYCMVLECWGNAGGEFKQSRAKPPETQTGTKKYSIPSGPTVLFVEAAAGPVMGEKAPGREAICKLIVRHRKFEAEMLLEMDAADQKAGRAAKIEGRGQIHFSPDIPGYVTRTTKPGRG